jgi:hypothetical protein
MKVKDKQFIKTADVNMEVKDVYNATISIEKSVQELGGFVTNSNLQSNVFLKTLTIHPMKKHADQKIPDRKYNAGKSSY